MEESSSPLWHNMATSLVLDTLGTKTSGLSSLEVIKRQEKYGKNALLEQKPPTRFQLFLEQFKSPLIYVLLLIAVATFVLGEYTDGFIISFVLLFNAIIGVIQEGRARNALLALRRFTATNVVVKRDGKEHMVPASELVPGDIVLISEGSKIPADARLINVESLVVDEAALTGESQPIVKTTAEIHDAVALETSQTNMVFNGTYAAGGQAIAVVVATGQSTRIGKIAGQIASIDSEIPLKRSLRKLTNSLIIAVFILAGLLFLVGLLQGNSAKEMFLVTASLVVAVIPEGLPVVMTLVLAQGVKRMSQKNILVKRLQAVEALGQAKIIAVDKTGTLTKNELVVQKIFVNNRVFSVTGIGYSLDGEVLLHGGRVDLSENKDLATIARMAVVSANARIFRSQDDVQIAGDPTEAAMMIAGEKIGFASAKWKEKEPLLDEIAFSYKTKFYANLHSTDKGQNIIYVTGAPEVVLNKCTTYWTTGGSAALDNKQKTQLQTMVEDWSSEGLRVIALSYKDTDQSALGDDVDNLVFVGFFAMKDALRPGVSEALSKVRAAGMRVVMITGDHRITARAIAAEAGIFKPGDRILTGSDVERYSTEDLASQLEDVTVFARVTPDHKLKIIQAFRNRGEIIAMTGDGVNDVPSLVAADLGVAMGKVGTEVTKEAADLVLLDDNFGNIAEAAEEGRHIYLSIKRIVLYLLSTNAGEMLVVVLAIAIGLPIPLIPAQIIWMNLVTDSFLVLPLGLEPRGKSLLNSDFRRGKNIIGKENVIYIFIYAIAMAVIGLFVFFFITDMTSPEARSLLLTTLVGSQIFIAINIRLRKHLFFSRYTFTNYWFLLAIVGVLALQWGALSLPFMQNLLGLAPLTIYQFGMAIFFASAILWIEELIKIIRSLIKK